MRFAKLKSTGRMIASLSGGEGADDLNKFASELGYPINEMDIGYEDEAVVQGWFLAQDKASLTYSDKRKAEYAKLNQDEMRFDDQVNSTTTWVDAINAIKTAHPKP